MKIDKNIYTYSVVVVAIVGSAIFWVSRDDKDIYVIDTATSTSPTSAPTPTPSKTPNLPKNSVKPIPTLIIKEINSYKYWSEILKPINRRLVLDENCTSIAPSQVAYPNNTQIMLDNTLSAEPRILKIASKGYSLDAYGWLLVTLSSTKLPAQLTMFCGSMELGQLDLE